MVLVQGGNMVLVQGENMVLVHRKICYPTECIVRLDSQCHTQDKTSCLSVYIVCLTSSGRK